MPKVSTSSLGGTSGVLADLASGGSASVTSGDLSQADSILDEASSQVAFARAEIGAFQRTTIDSSRSVIQDTLTNYNSAISQIADADIAAETAELVKAEIQVRAGIAALSITNERRSLIADLLAPRR